MGENEIGEIVIGAAIRVHRALGPGMLESTYEACLAHEISRRGLDVQRQASLPLHYDGIDLDAAYRIDLLVDGKVVVEVKAVEQMTRVHDAQLLSYLRLGNFKLGYLINFNVALLKDGLKRMVNGL
ncbi:MAG: GxxExxY protein [Alphaproteobacteria bacterium]|nr:GxxExxY protein [Alphaproteobacteria bacterium]